MNINLLPWRKKRNQQSLLIFFTSLLSIIIIAGLLMDYMNQTLAKQIKRFRFNHKTLTLKKNNSKSLSRQALLDQYQSLIIKANKIKNNQQRSWEFIEKLKTASQLLPRQTAFYQLNINPHQISIKGKTNRLGMITKYINRLAESNLFRNIKLQSVTHDSIYHFNIILGW